MASSPRARRLSPRETLLSLTVAVALFMEGLDSTIINTSLPAIAKAFRVSSLDIGLGITAYLLACAVLLPAGNWITDRFGVRKIFAAAIILFTLASAGCAVADGFWGFIAMRAGQGAAGALMGPVGRVVVLRGATKANLIEATALITWPALIAPVIGPALGGAITTYISWRWNFLLNLPVGALILVMIAAFVPEGGEDVPRRLDWPGLALGTAALSMIVWGCEGLTRAPMHWQAPLVLALCGGLIGGVAVRHYARAEAPLLDLSCARDATFSAAVLGAGFVWRLVINATPFLLPLMLQLGFGMSPARAGLYVLVYFAGNFVMKSVTTPILRGLRFRRTLVATGMVEAISLLGCGWLEPASPLALTLILLFAAGLARSMMFTSLNTLAFADIAAHQRGPATTVMAIAQRVAQVGAVAGTSVMLAAFGARTDSGAVLAADHLAFRAMGVLGLVATLGFARLGKEAGDALRA